VPLGVSVHIVAWVKAEGPRSLRARALLLLRDGVLAVEGQGIFAHAPALFDAPDSEFGRYDRGQ
jgi:hypothetical protein